MWDHTKPPNHRIVSIHSTKPNVLKADELDNDDDPNQMVQFYETPDGTRVEVKKAHAVQGEEVKREKGGKIYRIITRNYMAEGYDGFEALKNRKFIIDDDEGQIMSQIVRSFLLGECSSLSIQAAVVADGSIIFRFCLHLPP